ncbi:MAG: DUF2723 domain-containing protein [Chloroflexi bacterium]|nr:DUF2723 domain-containing protein [Chloroflexota bacterium]
MITFQKIWNEKRDALISALIGVAAFALYARTLAPSVVFLFDDTLDFQYTIPRLGIPHQTGYPLYALLGKIFTLLVPLNDPAFRVNLFTALCGALAVAFVYLIARHLIASRIAALVAALSFAVSKTFWENAVVAEIYTLQMLLTALTLYLTLIWRDEIARGNIANAQKRFYALAFAMGLGLAHHRLIAFTYPAIALYVLWNQRFEIRDWRFSARAALWFVAPLALYLYLPLRGPVGSADGAYQNTLAGFFDWITARQYTIFLSDNPLQIQRDANFYSTLLLDQFGWLGLALAAIGIVWLARKPREWALLVLALIAIALFAFNYRVADVQVYFLTTFLILAIFIGAGADALWKLFSIFDSRSWIFRLALGALFFAIPYYLLFTNYASTDLSSRWDVHDYGRDILNQPLESNATIIGIVGEMTLVRYFQDAHNLRPDVQTISADQEDARLAQVDRVLKENRAVYLTRPLKGLAEKYPLASVGPLIRVQPSKPFNIARPLDADFGAVKLIGYDLDIARLNAIPDRWHAENGRVLRVTLYWQAVTKIENDALVSIKIARSDRRVIGQVDHRPVRDAYPTTQWRAGQVIADTYDVPLALGITPSNYAISVTLYDAQSSAVIGQRELEPIALGPDVRAPRREMWNIARTLDADFGALALVGYSLDATTLRPGDALPLTLLWRGGANKLPDHLNAHFWLEDAQAKTVGARDAPISVGFPPMLWSPNVYVRDWSAVRVPANVADGVYRVKLAVARDQNLLGSAVFPFWDTVADLGFIEIKNRARVMTAPAIAQAREAVFDQKIKLLGYELKLDAQRNVRLVVYWRALGLMDTAYTVFVHLLDAKGNLLASVDAEPGNGVFPTTGWIENEYITDARVFPSVAEIPPGEYHIAIGLYDAVTGARLKTADGKDGIVLEGLTLY